MNQEKVLRREISRTCEINVIYTWTQTHSMNRHTKYMNEIMSKKQKKRHVLDETRHPCVVSVRARCDDVYTSE